MCAGTMAVDLKSDSQSIMPHQPQAADGNTLHWLNLSQRNVPACELIKTDIKANSTFLSKTNAKPAIPRLGSHSRLNRKKPHQNKHYSALNAQL